MTKSQLIELLSARHSQLAPKDAELAVKVTLDAMAHTLASEMYRNRGFGSFGLNYRPPHGAQPKTGEGAVPRKYVPHFRPARSCGAWITTRLMNSGNAHNGGPVSAVFTTCGLWNSELNSGAKRHANRRLDLIRVVVVLVWFAVKNAQVVTIYGLPGQNGRRLSCSSCSSSSWPA
jgi:integration host factor subunit beta